MEGSDVDGTCACMSSPTFVSVHVLVLVLVLCCDVLLRPGSLKVEA